MSTTQGYNNADALLYPMCKAYTTILLEEKDTGIVHLIQLTFLRSETFNDQIIYDTSRLNPPLTWNSGISSYDCMNKNLNVLNFETLDTTGATSFYKKYSYRLSTSAPGYQLF